MILRKKNRTGGVTLPTFNYATKHSGQKQHGAGTEPSMRINRTEQRAQKETHTHEANWPVSETRT